MEGMLPFSYDDLPSELLAMILNLIDPVSLVVCAFVCRRWDALLPRSDVEKRADDSSITQDKTLSAKEVLRLIEFRKQHPPRPKRMTGEFFAAAIASHGYLNILRWARDLGCPWDERVCNNAAQQGHLDILEYAVDAGCSDWQEAFGFAARQGYLKILEWGRKRGGAWNGWIACEAARGGQLEVLKWMKADGCHLPAGVCESAAEGGHLHVLIWAREQKCPWDESVCASAAEAGHLDLLMGRTGRVACSTGRSSRCA